MCWDIVGKDSWYIPSVGTYLVIICFAVVAKKSVDVLIYGLQNSW